MAARPRTPAELLSALKAVEEHNGSVHAAAKALGVPYSTLQHRYDAAVAWRGSGEQSKPLAAESLSVKGDTAELTKTTSERVRTLADLIRVCQIDTTEWDVERWVANKWDSAAKLGKDETERITVTELYQIKVWLKRNRPLMAARAEIEQLKKDAAKLPPLARVAPRRASTGYMLEINVADLHNGKLAWSKESGANYDSRLAESFHDAAVDMLLKRTSVYAFDEILIVLGNDLLHVDSRNNTTTAGTQQDMDSRYYKVFVATRRMAQRTIERCRKLAKVRVSMVPGNHDRDSVWHLGDSLSCLYDKCPDVVIDNDPTQRKYVEFGKVMLLLTHGDKGKREDYPLLMATEQPGMFGRTVYREIHTGHLHQTKVQEFHGVRVRILPSLAGADAWHAENGYVGNLRAAEAFVWSATEGLVATAYYNVPQELDAEGAA